MIDLDYARLLGKTDAQTIAFRLQKARPEMRFIESDVRQVVQDIISDVYQGSIQTNTILHDSVMLDAYRGSLVRTLVDLGYLSASSVEETVSS